MREFFMLAFEIPMIGILVYTSIIIAVLGEQAEIEFI